MLRSSGIIAFVPVRDPGAARAFYEGVLGLPVIREDPFALVLDANGVTIRLAKVGDPAAFRAAAYTVLGWRVADVAETARALVSCGVSLTRYPGMQQDALGIWTSPGGAKVAWFQDPDGNVLSVTEE